MGFSQPEIGTPRVEVKLSHCQITCQEKQRAIDILGAVFID